MKRVLPHPVMSLVVALAWLLLTDLSAGQLALAALSGIGLPLFTQRFMPGASRLRGWRSAPRAVHLAALVTWDIVVANVAVARLVLGPPDRLRSAFIEVPLELEQPLARSLLASIVTMTPGTVSADFSPDGRRLLVHLLHSDDPQAVARSIKDRYERPLTGIFL